MCGLVSIHSDGQDLSNQHTVFDEMLQSLSHRGPDGEGMALIDDQILMGHKRLAIIDVNNGSQPMISKCGRFRIIYNGEIYNYKELKNELKRKNIQFRTNSDTEVLLEMLIEYGEAALKRLNGMFAFVFHDYEKNKWIAARDHFGIKPIYYHNSSKNLIFSSEIKALLKHPDIDSLRDDTSLNQYLSFQFCLGSRTLFKGIKIIKPGFYMTGIGTKILENKSYWDPSYDIDLSQTESEYIEEIKFILKDSMRLQMRSDVPVGGYLSGGIDSSLVCSLASALSKDPFPMFHGKFAEGKEFDESFYAREQANFSNGVFHEIIPDAKGFVEDLPLLIKALDEPLAGPGLYPQYKVSKLAKEQVTVVLGGQGGDEIFGGYARYLVGYLEQALKGAILGNQDEGSHLVTLESIVPNLGILKEYTPLMSHFWKDNLFGDMDRRYFHLIDRSQGVEDILHQDTLDNFDKDLLFNQFQEIFNKPDTESYINKMTHFDQLTLLPALLQIEDRVSMSVSLESRVPLLDKRLVNIINKMPPPLKFQGGKTKNILKKSIKEFVPDSILSRQDKMGFPVPLNIWMQGGIVRDFVGDTLLSEKSKRRGIFKEEALTKMLDSQGVGNRQLWGALCLELWHREYLDAS